MNFGYTLLKSTGNGKTMNITTISRTEFRKIKKQLLIEKAYYETPAGILEISFTPQGILKAAFVAQKLNESIIPADLLHKFVFIGSPLQIEVWEALLQIPANQTMTYQELAERIGRPTAWRAVANAVARNDIAYFVPCHRVVRKNGDIGGYRWGEERKMMLLEVEGRLV